ncbi:thioester-containing protein 1 allele S1-like [Chironomus tepperi]|uniref:thioester-containing protein 1 allele S1-like n=1 Tax=Chironomus tepperi TaxID=113505 RepID=UPI00391F79EE
MKLDFIILLIFAIYCNGIQGQRVSIIGSQYIPENSNYKVLLLTNSLDKKSFVNVSLLSDGVESSSQLIKDFKDDSYSEVQFEVPQYPSNNYELNFKTSNNDACTQQSIKLMKSHVNPKIFVHLSKPIYKTGDDLKFRIFVLDKMMVPLTSHGQISVSIHDSKDNVIHKIDRIKTKIGVFEGLIKIADAPNLGRWKLVINLLDREIVKFFNVEKSVDEGLEVQLEMSSAVSFKDRRVYMTFIVSDKLNKFFIGRASIHASAKFKGSERIEINRHVKDVDIFGNKKGIGLDFADDLGIRYPTEDMMIKFDVTLTDAATKRTTKVSKEVEMKYKVRNVIQVIRKKYFKPGFKAPTKVRVKLLDGRLDNEFSELSITNEYHNRNPNSNKIQKIKKEFRVNLKNGETSNILQTKPETELIVVKLEFDGAELVEEIYPLPTHGANEYMQATIAKESTKIGDKISIIATTTGEMETLHVLVMGQDGIIVNKEYPEAAGNDIFKFTITLTQEMKPEARVLVFYVKPDSGVIIYDELTIALGFSIDNTIDIYADPLTKPNQQAKIQFKTTQGSKVYISAYDLNPLSLNRDNEISRNDVYNELAFYMNLRYPNSSEYHFEKSNAFILNPLNSEESCDAESTKVLSYDTNNADTAPNSNNDIKYFPDNWFDESYEAVSDDLQTINHKVPEALTTFKYFGISVHPNKGLTIAKAHNTTTVKSEFSIQLKAPTSVYKEEILWINVAVFNTLFEAITSDVSVTIENGVFVDKHPRVEYHIQCLDFKETNSKSKKFTLNIGDEKLSATETMLIQPDGNGDIKLTVQASTASHRDKVIKVVKLLNKSNQNEQISEDIKVENEEELPYTNILTAAVDGLDRFFSYPLTSDEERLLKFSAAITSHKYLLLGNADVQKSINNLIAGYQEVLSILDKIFQVKDPNSITLAALAARTLIEVQQFINIDQNLIAKSLDFVKTQQQDYGSFNYDSNFDYREEMDENPKDIQTAEIISVFLKTENRQDHQNVIGKALKYLKDISMTSDYQKVTAAYAFALNNDKYDAQNLLKDDYLTSKSKRQQAVNIEVAAYTILTKILLDQDPQDDVKWLIKKLDANNGFYSPHDADLALHALYEHAKFKHLRPKDNSQFGQVGGNGYPANTSDYFTINANRVEVSHEEFKLDISVNVNDDQSVNNLLVLEMELPRGYRYLRYDPSENVLSFDTLNNGNLVIFKMNKLKKDQITKMSIYASKVYEFSKHQFSMIKVYDYYRSNIKDTFYYVYDKNEESCERIRVEKEIERTEQIERNAEYAQSITSAAQSINDGANQSILHAERTSKQATNKLESANSAITSAHQTLSSALESAEKAYKITVDAEGRREIPVEQERPPRFRRDISDLESEAIKTQSDAQQAKQAADDAKKEQLQAQVELKNSILNLKEAQEIVLYAKNLVSRALSDVRAAKGDSMSVKQKILDAQNTAKKAEDELSNLNQELSSVDQQIKSARNKYDQTQEAIDNNQNQVTKAYKTALNVLEKAKKALKGDDVRKEVDDADVRVQEALTEANNALSLANDALQHANQAKEAILSVKSSINTVKTKCEAIKYNAESLLQQADSAYDISQDKCDVYKKAQKVEDVMTKSAQEAQHSLKTAEEKSENATKLYNRANAEAMDAQKLADEARANEAKNAESNANIAAELVEMIKGKVEQMLSDLTINAHDVRTEINSIRFDAIKDILYLEKKQFAYKDLNSISSVRQKAEINQLNNLNNIVRRAEDLTINAKRMMNITELYLKEAMDAARKANESTDAIETTNESTKVTNSLNNIIMLAKNLERIESNLNNHFKAISEKKDIAISMSESAKMAKTIWNNADTIKRNCNTAQTSITEANQVLQNAINKVRDSTVSQLKDDLGSMLNKVDFNSRIEKIEADLKTINPYELAEKARNSSTIVMANATQEQIILQYNNVNNLMAESVNITNDAQMAHDIAIHALRAVQYAIQAKNNVDEVATISNSVNYFQSGIDSVINLVLDGLKGLNFNHDSNNDLVSLYHQFMSTIEASKSDEKLSSLAITWLYTQSVANNALQFARSTINADSLENALESANQAEKSRNDTAKCRSDAIKIAQIAKLTEDTSKEVIKAANSFMAASNDAISAENTLKDIHALAEPYASLHNARYVNLIDQLTNLIQEVKSATEETQEAAKNALNKLRDAENHRKSLERLYDYENIEQVMYLVEQAKKSADEAEKEAKSAKNARQRVDSAVLEAQEAANKIQKAVKAEKAAEAEKAESTTLPNQTNCQTAKSLNAWIVYDY